MRKIFYLFLILLIVLGSIFWVYFNYRDQIATFIFDDQAFVIYLESSPLSVTVADELEEQKAGLSGVQSLGEREGKLFVFPKEDYYGMWMQDMFFPIDMIWINNDLRIVHIEENVSPDTFPDTFVSSEPARFVLETNAFFARNSNVVVGDEVFLPAEITPRDLLKPLR